MVVLPATRPGLKHVSLEFDAELDRVAELHPIMERRCKVVHGEETSSGPSATIAPVGGFSDDGSSDVLPARRARNKAHHPNT